MSKDRDLTPREARDRFLLRRKSENTENTVRSYRNRLTRFVEWAEQNEIESMAELDGWLLDEYRAHREDVDVAPTTLKGQLVALKQLLDFCVSIDVVDDDELPKKVNIPELSKDEETSDDLLEAQDARSLLEFYRNSRRHCGVSRHALLEVLWHVGPRISCVRALDLDDWNPADRTLKFRNRPPTRLKDGTEHERNVVVSEDVAEVLDLYIARERTEIRDENGRKPLFTTLQGRASEATIRGWSYLATIPCLDVECPHGNRRPTCEFTERSDVSKCPSSRSPHAVRTGSITWQLNNGLSYVKVARRVAASPETIRRYYDKPDHEQDLDRRRPITEKLDIKNDDED
ncbi:integrase [Halostagnicola sp. A56]|uniref:tyrosine-type recombinase/integrase n=1 Tax=Halostagnicola sp. A56 TaxID=1495067 RepID=UPI0004A14F92|nr:site-specific integrase [Halostagnicola sp. A56]KDE56702.1 integrase [Halostagnicola sp. A56]